MNTEYLCIAYDCPDETLINEIFSVSAPSIKDARREAWKRVPHAIRMWVGENDEEDDDE